MLNHAKQREYYRSPPRPGLTSYNCFSNMYCVTYARLFVLARLFVMMSSARGRYSLSSLLTATVIGPSSLRWHCQTRRRRGQCGGVARHGTWPAFRRAKPAIERRVTPSIERRLARVAARKNEARLAKAV